MCTRSIIYDRIPEMLEFSHNSGVVFCSSFFSLYLHWRVEVMTHHLVICQFYLFCIYLKSRVQHSNDTLINARWSDSAGISRKTVYQMLSKEQRTENENALTAQNTENKHWDTQSPPKIKTTKHCCFRYFFCSLFERCVKLLSALNTLIHTLDPNAHTQSNGYSPINIC